MPVNLRTVVTWVLKGAAHGAVIAAFHLYVVAHLIFKVPQSRIAGAYLVVAGYFVLIYPLFEFAHQAVLRQDIATCHLLMIPVAATGVPLYLYYAVHFGLLSADKGLGSAIICLVLVPSVQVAAAWRERRKRDRPS
jgi:hypothetical protein